VAVAIAGNELRLGHVDRDDAARRQQRQENLCIELLRAPHGRRWRRGPGASRRKEHDELPASLHSHGQRTVGHDARLVVEVVRAIAVRERDVRAPRHDKCITRGADALAGDGFGSGSELRGGGQTTPRTTFEMVEPELLFQLVGLAPAKNAHGTMPRYARPRSVKASNPFFLVSFVAAHRR
jgi:hypothetical protein